MNTETTQLEREIKAMGEQIKTKQHKLDTIRQMCDHKSLSRSRRSSRYDGGLIGKDQCGFHELRRIDGHACAQLVENQRIQSV